MADDHENSSQGPSPAAGRARPKIHFNADGVVPAARSQKFDISDKLAEGRYFLRLLRNSSDIDEARWLTSACLKSSQAALDQLAWRIRHALDFSDPDAAFEPDELAEAAIDQFLEIFPKGEKGGRSWQARASLKHPLLRRIHEHRKETAHYGPIWIAPLPPREGERLDCVGAQFVICDPVIEGVHSSDPYEVTYGWIEGPRVVCFLEQVLDLIAEVHARAEEAPRDTLE